MRRPAPFKKRAGTKGGTSSRSEHRALLEACCFDVNAVLAVDPDAKTVGVCAWKVGEPEPSWVATTHAKSAGVMHAASLYQEVYNVTCEAESLFPELTYLVVVEAMRIRQVGESRTKNPQSLVDLSFLSGLSVGAVIDATSAVSVLPVEPHYWKGGLSKVIHHKQIMAKIGWESVGMKGYARPKDIGGTTKVGKINPGDWKHVMDGVGLARWGVMQIEQTRIRLQHRRARGR